MESPPRRHELSRTRPAAGGVEAGFVDVEVRGHGGNHRPNIRKVVYRYAVYELQVDHIRGLILPAWTSLPDFFDFSCHTDMR